MSIAMVNQSVTVPSPPQNKTPQQTEKQTEKTPQPAQPQDSVHIENGKEPSLGQKILKIAGSSGLGLAEGAGIGIAGGMLFSVATHMSGLGALVPLYLGAIGGAAAGAIARPIISSNIHVNEDSTLGKATKVATKALEISAGVTTAGAVGLLAAGATGVAVEKVAATALTGGMIGVGIAAGSLAVIGGVAAYQHFKK